MKIPCKISKLSELCYKIDHVFDYSLENVLSEQWNRHWLSLNTWPYLHISDIHECMNVVTILTLKIIYNYYWQLITAKHNYIWNSKRGSFMNLQLYQCKAKGNSSLNYSTKKTHLLSEPLNSSYYTSSSQSHNHILFTKTHQ